MAIDKERKAAINKAWREANKERDLARQKAWREANKERESARQKARYEANKERESARQKAWREANRDRLLDKHRNAVESLSTFYVAATMGMKTAECPPELIEIKREQLAITRLVKQLNETIKEKTNAE